MLSRFIPKCFNISKGCCVYDMLFLSDGILVTAADDGILLWRWQQILHSLTTGENPIPFSTLLSPQVAQLIFCVSVDTMRIAITPRA